MHGLRALLVFLKDRATPEIYTLSLHDALPSVQLARRAIELFQPDALVLSLGFDIHEKDPQSTVAVSEAGFERYGREIARYGVPTLIVQEGGYYIEGLQANATRFFEGFAA